MQIIAIAIPLFVKKTHYPSLPSLKLAEFELTLVLLLPLPLLPFAWLSLGLDLLFFAPAQLLWRMTAVLEPLLMRAACFLSLELRMTGDFLGEMVFLGECRVMMVGDKDMDRFL